MKGVSELPRQGSRRANWTERRAKKPPAGRFHIERETDAAYRRFFQLRGMTPPPVSSDRLDFAMDWHWDEEVQRMREQFKSARSYNHD